MHWSPDDDALLRALLAQGARVPAISMALGRTKGAVIGRAGRIGLSLRNPRDSRTRMNDLTDAEQATIDAAEHDGEGWAIPESTNGSLLDGLAIKDLIRLRGRWELTPLGYSRTTRFAAIGKPTK
jgi:hypothetical protein